MVLRTVTKAVSWRARTALTRDRNGDPAATVFVMGSPRSGTTWLAEMLNARNEYRLLFEPAWAVQVPAFSAFVAPQYVDPEDSSVELADPLHRLVRGDVRGQWVDHVNRRFLPRKRLVKEVRGNLFLPWIAAHYPQTKVVLIVRHPLKVAASRVSLRWHDRLGQIVGQDALFRRYPALDRDYLDHVRSPAVGAIVQWAIETRVALQSVESPSVLPVLYEDLADELSGCLPKICKHIGQEFGSELLARASRASSTTRRNLGADLPHVDLELDRHELSAIRTAFDMCDLTGLYALDDRRGDPSALVRSDVAGWAPGTVAGLIT